MREVKKHLPGRCAAQKFASSMVAYQSEELLLIFHSSVMRDDPPAVAVRGTWYLAFTKSQISRQSRHQIGRAMEAR